MYNNEPDLPLNQIFFANVFFSFDWMISIGTCGKSKISGLQNLKTRPLSIYWIMHIKKNTFQVEQFERTKVQIINLS